MVNLAGVQANCDITKELNAAGILIMAHEELLKTEPITNLTGKTLAAGTRIPVYEDGLLDGRLFGKCGKNQFFCYKENNTDYAERE